MLVLKALHPDAEGWNKDFVPALSALVGEFSPYINLYHLAFPQDWISQLYK